MCWRALFVVAFKQGPVGWAKLCGMYHRLAFMPKYRDYQLVACSFTTAVLERAVSLPVPFSINFSRKELDSAERQTHGGRGNAERLSARQTQSPSQLKKLSSQHVVS